MPATMTPHRLAVVQALLDAGGTMEDQAGLVAGKLRERTGHKTTQALSGVLQAMEEAGIIRREMAGRRTYKIELVAAPESTNGSVAAAPERTIGAESDGEVNYEELAAALLKQAMRALTKNAGEDTQLGRKYLTAQREADDLQDRVKHLEAELRHRSEALLEANRTVLDMEKNQKKLMAQLDRPAHREQVSIKDRVSDEERQALAKLMKETPARR